MTPYDHLVESASTLEADSIEELIEELKQLLEEKRAEERKEIE